MRIKVRQTKKREGGNDSSSPCNYIRHHAVGGGGEGGVEFKGKNGHVKTKLLMR